MGDDVTTETWRVIEESGNEHAALVESSEGKLIAVTIGRRCGYPCDTPFRAAVAREAFIFSIPVAEILAPGQRSRAEVEASLRASQEFAGTLMVRHRERDAEVEASAFARGVEASARECEKMAATVRGERVVYGNGAPSEDVAIALDSVAAVIRDIAATKPEPSSADVLEAIRAGRIKCESCGNVATGGHIACGRCAD